MKRAPAPWQRREVTNRSTRRAGSSPPSSSTADSGPSRRDFLKHGARLGLAAMVPPVLTHCGGSDDDSPPAQATHQATLFFNLSHEDHVGRTYYLTGGGRRHVLKPVREDPSVLAKARSGNAFLRSVPDQHITHHIESATFASEVTTLTYVSSEIDTQAGTWAMSSVQLYIPPSGAKAAFASARRRTPNGPLPLSAKRLRYGIAAAHTEADLLEERSLFDSTSHAATLVGCHPDLMCLDPGGAHTTQAVHIETDQNVQLIASALADPSEPYGAAQPEATAGQLNDDGWATLRPVPGDNGQPLVNQNGLHKGRIQYLPDLHPDLAASTAQAIRNSANSVKDDTTLGADASALQPSDPADASLNGVLWTRRDGVTAIDQSAGATSTRLGSGAGTMTLAEDATAAGWKVTASASGQQVSLSLVNFFANFRGVFLQFYDGDTLLKLADIPEYAAGTIVAGHDDSMDTPTEMWVSMLGSAYLLFGIPVAPGYITPKFTVPAGATSVRVLSSTLSMQANNIYPATVVPGAVMTGVFNYGVTALMCAMGAGKFVGPALKAVVVPFMQALTLELVSAISLALAPGADGSLIGVISKPAFWTAQAFVVAKMLVNVAASGATKALVAYIAAAATEGAAEDAVPLAGQISMAVSLVMGAVSIAETTIELACMPWTIVDELTFTHDLTVKLKPDPNDDTFPKAATHYSVTALFDHATPVVQDFTLPSPVPATLPDVTFAGVPLGGNVNVTVAFVQKATAVGGTDITLGRGTTGLIANNASAAPTITIEEIAFPIDSTTTYRHQAKTVLADSAGNHAWRAADAPTETKADVVCAGPGSVCAYHSISVRQGTSTSRGFVGYSWQSQNTDASIGVGCSGGGVGQLDQIANLNTNPGTNGAGAQDGYANGSCGINQAGVKVAYSLLSDDARNFYLDTSDPAAPIIRKVTLGGAPAFDPPGTGQAWGVLNLSSDALLLHPMGHLVSINNANHKIETHRLPGASMADADAKSMLVATVKSGKGSRPGLVENPVAAAVSRTGVVLVLESGNNRIQALDLGTNPVRHFKNQSTPYYMTLTATDPVQGWRYLDLAVEYTGFIYVLAYNENSLVYRMDIYHPDLSDSTPISTTQGINAARLTVDLWRNVYTMNYEVLKLPNGSPAGLTEPSISLWTPCSKGLSC